MRENGELPKLHRDWRLKDRCLRRIFHFSRNEKAKNFCASLIIHMEEPLENKPYPPYVFVAKPSPYEGMVFSESEDGHYIIVALREDAILSARDFAAARKIDELYRRC